MKSANDISWLHISDFHLKAGRHYDQDVVLKAFTESLPSLVSRFGKPDFVVVSGDLAFSGQAAEYELVTKLLDQIALSLGLSRERFIVTPGNHDVDRSKGTALFRAVNSQEEYARYFDSDEDLLHIKYKLQSFKEWYDQYFLEIREFPLDTTFSLEVIKIDDKEILFALMNTALFCFDDSDHGKIALGRSKVDKALQGINVSQSKFFLKIAVGHHPFSWFHQLEQTQIKTKIRDFFDLVLHGHLHEREVEQIVSSSGDAIGLATGALYQTRKWPNTAMICKVQGDELSVIPLHYSDAPRPVWTLDASLFPSAAEYQGKYQLSDGGASRASAVLSANTSTVGIAVDAGAVEEVSKQLSERLMFTPGGKPIFAIPRIMKRPQASAFDSSDDDSFSVDELVKSTQSFFVEGRPEYGNSVLSRVLQQKILAEGKGVILRNSRSMPNYKKKILSDLNSEIEKFSDNITIILDDFDLERDERLLSELYGTEIFSRVILISVNRRISDGVVGNFEELPFTPQVLYLWAMARPQIREFAQSVLEANDSISVEKAVEKVYSDLLSLKIPLTPSNVLMYLRVLQREGDFEPLSKVDILSRFLNEILRKPSDTTTDSFNSKNKMDVISSFSFKIHEERKHNFDDRYWLNFCHEYQEKTLSVFDAKEFLDELLESRVFARYKESIYFRYSFYFTFFFGRYLTFRGNLLQKFIDSGDYLMNRSVLDVVTSLSSENSDLIRLLNDKLYQNLKEFREQYVKEEFDPLIDALWPNSEDEEERLWGPVQKAIEAGPAEGSQIDELKTSMLAEARSEHQQIIYKRFSALETSLFANSNILADALKNSDDIDGSLKIESWKLILLSQLISFQIGSILYPHLAKSRRIRWGGIEFIGFDKAAQGLEEGVVAGAIIQSLSFSIAAQFAQEHASIKLSQVFKHSCDNDQAQGFMNLVNFSCIAVARGKDWHETLKVIIEKIDKNAFYLSEMLNQLLNILEYEVMTGGERDKMKLLVALIQAKRNYGKQIPGARAVKSMARALEKQSYYPDEIEKD